MKPPLLFDSEINRPFNNCFKKMKCFWCECMFSETRFPFILSCGNKICCDCVEKIQKSEFPCPNNCVLTKIFCVKSNQERHPPTFHESIQDCIDSSESIPPSTTTVSEQKEVCEHSPKKIHPINSSDKIHSLGQVDSSEDKIPSFEEAEEASQYVGQLEQDDVEETGKTAVITLTQRFELSERSLIDASKNGELEVVRALLDRGEDMNQKDEKGYTPLYYASSNGHLPIVSLLLSNIDQNKFDEDTALLSAMSKGHLSIVSLILDKGTNISEKNNSRSFALHHAIRSGNLPIVSLLLDKGAKINHTKDDALHDPIRDNQHQILTLRRLLTDEDEEDNSRFTPLRNAILSGHLHIVSLFLDRGARVNDKCKNGDTPLHLAIEEGHLSIVSILLDRGANINEKGNNGLTPLHNASKNGHFTIISFLLDKGANINEKDDDCNTPLHWASIYGHLPIAFLLLDRGANINDTTRDGSTALHIASRNSELPVVSLLLVKGASINEKNNFGYTPLHYASANGRLPIVSLLLDKGANINEKDNYESTALYFAVINNNRDVIALLRDRGGTK